MPFPHACKVTIGITKLAAGRVHSFKELIFMDKRKCHCCQKEMRKERPRICPECNHYFDGNGWEGIDAHWRSKHQNIMCYEDF